MSPENRKKLNALRKRLDILDNKLLSLISIRSNIVKDVLKLKNYKNEIVDKWTIWFSFWNKSNLYVCFFCHFIFLFLLSV